MSKRLTQSEKLLELVNNSPFGFTVNRSHCIQLKQSTLLKRLIKKGKLKRNRITRSAKTRYTVLSVVTLA